MQRRSSRGDRAAQEPVPGELSMVPQQPLALHLRLGVQHAVPDVVDDGADIRDMVVHPFQLQEQAAQQRVPGRTRDPERLLHGQHVGQAVPDRGIPADPFGQVDPGRRGAPLEQPLHPAVDEPEPRLHPQVGLRTTENRK